MRKICANKVTVYIFAIFLRKLLIYNSGSKKENMEDKRLSIPSYLVHVLLG